MINPNVDYKMVVMDMDYTLLNRKKEVSERNRQAIVKAIEKGIIVVLATGRIFSSARKYARDLQVLTPVIASNGAIIADYLSDKIYYKNLLPEPAILKMIELSHKYQLYCHLYTMDKIYTERIVNISTHYLEWNNTLPDADKINVIVEPCLSDAILKEKGNILKAVVVDNDSSKINGLREEILATGIVSASQSLKDNVEVMNIDVSKGNAVRYLAEMYKIPRSQVIAIGDNENDISMIEYAGLGIAVGNAEEKLKIAADYVTGHYENDGVAEAIEKFILKA